MNKRVAKLEDHRDAGKVKHCLPDVFMSGFAMMYFQDPSLLEFQRNLEDKGRINNLRTLFGVKTIPKDSQMRDIIDEIDSEKIKPIFDDFFEDLRRGKHLEGFRFMKDYYLVSVDGSEYFGSDKIQCPGCLRKESKNGRMRYEHQILQSVVIHPDMKQVIPLASEEIKNSDGNKKQDCETQAGKRVIQKIRQIHPRLKIIIVGDSLYSKQPFIEKLVENHMRYILGAKDEDHKLLVEWVNEQRQLGEVSSCKVTDIKGVVHEYEWINEVPLNGREDAHIVNYFTYRIVRNGKVTYKNSWVTDIRVTEYNVQELVRGGRSRWKIENETFNTLKNHGYHIEHNFGHGKKNLSVNFFLLNLLAFFVHQIFELTDALYQKCRGTYSSRRAFWEGLKNAIIILIFPDWQTLLQRLIDPLSFL
ncbi:MAG: transposase [Nitrospirae bacterium]|nr:transposase [Nitrospirota bacterium]